MSQDEELTPKTNEPESNATDEPEPTAKTENEVDEPLQRPDPTFKRVTEKVVVEISADSKATELKTNQPRLVC